MRAPDLGVARAASRAARPGRARGQGAVHRRVHRFRQARGRQLGEHHGAWNGAGRDADRLGERRLRVGHAAPRGLQVNWRAPAPAGRAAPRSASPDLRHPRLRRLRHRDRRREGRLLGVDARAAGIVRVEGPLHRERHLLVRAVELEVGGQQLLPRALVVGRAAAEVEQRPLQRQERRRRRAGGEHRPRRRPVLDTRGAARRAHREHRQPGALRDAHAGCRGAARSHHN